MTPPPLVARRFDALRGIASSPDYRLRPLGNDCTGHGRYDYDGSACCGRQRGSLATSDLDVYWTVMGQLRRQAKGLPEGTPITGVVRDR